MNDAAWLLLALPQWYFGTILAPLSAGPLTAVPAAGIVCLILGSILGLRLRARRLLAFVIPAGFSELFVAVAGALRGQVSESTAQPALLGFLLLQLLLCIYLVYRSGARVAASALALFSLTYALFAAFVAAMAFSDTWL